MKKFVSILLIFVLVFSMSCIAFAEDVQSPEHDNTDPGTDAPTPGPQTGDNGAIYWVIALAVLALGTAAFCGKKLIANK